MKLPEAERCEYDNYLENLGYHRSMLGSSYRMGDRMGEIRGIAIGREAGIVIGREAGEQAKTKEIVLKMHSKNPSIPDILEMTGLSIAEVKAVIAEN